MILRRTPRQPEKQPLKSLPLLQRCLDPESQRTRQHPLCERQDAFAVELLDLGTAAVNLDESQLLAESVALPLICPEIDRLLVDNPVSRRSSLCWVALALCSAIATFALDRRLAVVPYAAH
jgi:hypothetical protein